MGADDRVYCEKAKWPPLLVCSAYPPGGAWGSEIFPYLGKWPFRHETESMGRKTDASVASEEPGPWISG